MVHTILPYQSISPIIMDKQDLPNEHEYSYCIWWETYHKDLMLVKRDTYEYWFDRPYFKDGQKIRLGDINLEDIPIQDGTRLQYSAGQLAIVYPEDTVKVDFGSCYLSTSDIFCIPIGGLLYTPPYIAGHARILYIKGEEDMFRDVWVNDTISFFTIDNHVIALKMGACDRIYSREIIRPHKIPTFEYIETEDMGRCITIAGKVIKTDDVHNIIMNIPNAKVEKSDTVLLPSKECPFDLENVPAIKISCLSNDINTIKELITDKYGDEINYNWCVYSTKDVLRDITDPQIHQYKFKQYIEEKDRNIDKLVELGVVFKHPMDDEQRLSIFSNHASGIVI